MERCSGNVAGIVPSAAFRRARQVSRYVIPRQRISIRARARRCRMRPIKVGQIGNVGSILQ